MVIKNLLEHPGSITGTSSTLQQRNHLFVQWDCLELLAAPPPCTTEPMSLQWFSCIYTQNTTQHFQTESPALTYSASSEVLYYMLHTHTQKKTPCNWRGWGLLNWWPVPISLRFNRLGSFHRKTSVIFLRLTSDNNPACSVFLSYVFDTAVVSSVQVLNSFLKWKRNPVL